MLKLFMHVLVKYISCKTSIYIVTSSTRDRNDTAVVMQINFTELKTEINGLQRIYAWQCMKNYWWYSIQFHDICTKLEQWYGELKSFLKSFLRVGNSQNTNSSALIRFMCVGIVASFHLRHFTLLLVCK